MQSLRTGLVRERQRRALGGRSGGGLPLRLMAFLLAAAAAAAAAASAAAAAAAEGAAAVGAPVAGVVTGGATPAAEGVPGTARVSGDAAEPF